MKEIIAKGKSLENIRQDYAKKWNCLPNVLELTVIQKPGIVNKNYTVRVKLPNNKVATEKYSETRVIWDGVKYLIFPGDEVEVVVPFPMAGKLNYQGEELFEEFQMPKRESLEYYPLVNNGDFSWEIITDEDGTRATAKVRHEKPGRFVMDENIIWKRKWFLERYVNWVETPWEVRSETEQLFNDELKARGIVCGIIPDCWQKMMSVSGLDEIVIAEQIEPVLPINPTIEDFESAIVKDIPEKERIDFFASRVITCEQDEVIVRKVPGREGISGRTIFGKEIPMPKMKDIQLKAKKDVYLTDDGLEIRASVSGAPIKLPNYTYSLEKVYKVGKDVGIDTGSIEFPGDVIVAKDVLDGLHVYSAGRVSIQGLVSGAKLKAEGGISIGSNVFNSEITVGERHYIRYQFVQKLGEISDRLNSFIEQLDAIQNSEAKPNIPYKHIFRNVLEKKYKDIPTRIREISNLAQNEDEDFFTREVMIAVHTIKYFVIGIGPYEIKDDTYILNSLREIHNFLLENGSMVPEKVAFVAGYVQNSVIKCSGDFTCKKDIYNSTIKVEGNIKISGVCRGSRLISGGKIFVKELGSTEGGADTIVNIPSSGQINADFCHPNVKIFIGKECIPIEQSVRKLIVYMDKGKIRVDKIKWAKD